MKNRLRKTRVKKSHLENTVSAEFSDTLRNGTAVRKVKPQRNKNDRDEIVCPACVHLDLQHLAVDSSQLCIFL